ncbi:11635_t:CDS:1, partial [Gigaspora margarita]
MLYKLSKAILIFIVGIADKHIKVNKRTLNNLVQDANQITPFNGLFGYNSYKSCVIRSYNNDYNQLNNNDIINFIIITKLKKMLALALE